MKIVLKSKVTLSHKDELIKLLKTAMNDLNMGVPVNQGIQAAPDQQSMQQADQIVNDPQADMDAQGQLSMDKWKKGLTPGVNRALQLTPQQMARRINEELSFIKNPRDKATVQRLIDDCSKNPAKADMVFKQIINKINHVRKQDESLNRSQPNNTVAKPL